MPVTKSSVPRFSARCRLVYRDAEAEQVVQCDVKFDAPTLFEEHMVGLRQRKKRKSPQMLTRWRPSRSGDCMTRENMVLARGSLSLNAAMDRSFYCVDRFGPLAHLARVEVCGWCLTTAETRLWSGSTNDRCSPARPCST